MVLNGGIPKFVSSDDHTDDVSGRLGPDEPLASHGLIGDQDGSQLRNSKHEHGTMGRCQEGKSKEKLSPKSGKMCYVAGRREGHNGVKFASARTRNEWSRNLILF